MMETADLAAPGRYGLVRFRDGLLLAMMAARGRRLRSMSLLREGQEIHLVDDQYRIELQPHQVKTKKFDSFKLPRRLTPFIRKYIAMVRPTLLAGQSHEAFWIGINGEPLSAKGIEEVVFRCSRRRFGVGFGPHRFRHAIATTAAVRASDVPGLAAPLLGISAGVVEAHYDRANQVAAVRKFEAIIDGTGREDTARQRVSDPL